MANVRAGSLLGTPWMTPGEGLAAENMDVQGHWDDDAEAVELPEDLPVGEGISQGWIWRIFWDLHDADSSAPEPADFGFGEFDQWDGGGSSTSPDQHLLNRVVMDYLPQRTGIEHPEYEDRGQSGPDLVDMLDGFACLFGMDEDDMETLLHEVMSYEYDFAKCND